MAGEWKPVPINQKLFTNVQETVLRQANAAIENAFINESGGHTRFPGMRQFVALNGNAPAYLTEWQQDLIAVSNSRTYRIDSNGNVVEVTGVPLSGGLRPVFDKTPNELVMAAGAEIVRLASDKTEILSPDAPKSTHVQYVDGFLLASEVNTGRFRHCLANDFRTWDPIDVFVADSKPDAINAILVTPYREIIISGPDSIEQWNRTTSSSSADAPPFYRRWTTGDGLLAPYTLVDMDQGYWGIDKKRVLNRFSGQSADPKSDDIGRTLEKIDDWTDVWGVEMNIKGQKFYFLQFPFATNPYGTKGITMLFDIRQKKFVSLYSWDQQKFVQSRWPGWSYLKLWGRDFVGGNGKVLELVDDTFRNDGVKQIMTGRTAHLDNWGLSEVHDVRIRIKRGIGTSYDPKLRAPQIGLRCIRDNNTKTRYRYKSLGKPGDKVMIANFGGMGIANTWQFEWIIEDDCDIELVTMEAQVSRVGEG